MVGIGLKSRKFGVFGFSEVSDRGNWVIYPARHGRCVFCVFMLYFVSFRDFGVFMCYFGITGMFM